jgi:hypothetical protein
LAQFCGFRGASSAVDVLVNEQRSDEKGAKLRQDLSSYGGEIQSSTPVRPFRRDSMMLDFVYKLNEVLPSWPPSNKLSMVQIAKHTNTTMPHIIQFFSEGLSRELDIESAISFEEANRALELLKKRLKFEIEDREKILAERRASAILAFDRLMEKVIDYQRNQNWHSAFKTLRYFIGKYEEELSNEGLVAAYSEAIRSGIKASANMQELSLCLQKAIAIAMSQKNQEGIEEAIDLIDAYGGFFLNENSGKGPLLLGNILAALEEPAAKFELWDKFKALVDQFYSTT